MHQAWEGFASIRHVASGEIMHSRSDPMEEARTLYVDQARLAERLREPGEPLVIWDVGLGAAANAMAAIRCYEEQAQVGPVRPLHLVSFENDLDSLRLALLHRNVFPYLRHAGPPALLGNGAWESKHHPGVSWSLVSGDFPATIPEAATPPDLIFYDMFSGKTSGDAWTLATFRRLFAVCGHRAVELFTYSRSTAVRARLLAAGFFVARGTAMGLKEQTTIALTPTAPQHDRELLDHTWLERWERSQAKFPDEIDPSDHADFAHAIRQHPQFQRETTCGTSR